MESRGADRRDRRPVLVAEALETLEAARLIERTGAGVRVAQV
jgi:hypothetical protein